MCANHQKQLEWEEEPSTAIITAVAALAGVPADELPPLYGYVDPDALDGLFDSADARSDLQLSFSYLDYDVIVSQEREIVITNVNGDASVTCSQPADE
ncbi:MULTISPECIES: HalOD1 output domain-containing protein [Natrialbaceae]|uniref:HalOD1 output domain-containing protein n=1 Tax=Natrialbaceae TaxID=1644061 RepID=UPI00207D29EC|nr:HalOD1 output domain-containing protein [Natronococcus sp. CG52]